MLLERFTELGTRIGEAWRARRRDERAFPEIAARLLDDAALHRAYSFDALVDLLAVVDPLPTQNVLDEAFGQPPLTVFQGDGFNIEFLFWVDGLVTIHQHGFAGAFSVFEGSSVHARYQFTEKKRVNASVVLGDLDLVDAELLAKGDVREILAGPRLIHATFHLDRPTVSVVIRTERDHQGLPQYDYRPPSLAFDPFAARTAMRKRVQLLRMLHRTKREAYWRVLEKILAVSDWLGTYLVLDQGYMLSESAADRDRVMELARIAHGEDIDDLRPVLESSHARRHLVSRRDAETDPELRFFLALVLTVPRREKLLELVQVRFPGEAPADVAVRCLRKLGFDDDALVLSRALVEGRSEAEALKARLAEMGARFANDYSMLQAVRALRDTPGFTALLT